MTPSDTLLPLLGVAGIGAMGLPMAQRLHAQGYLVQVFDPDLARQQLAAYTGLTIAPNPGALVAACDVVLVVVLDAVQLETLMDDWLANQVALADKVILLCSTLSPTQTQTAAARLTRVGAHVLDAPVSGGPQRALDGVLSVMLAGCPKRIAQQAAWMAALFSKVVVIGERIGDATKAKLVNNFLAGVHLQAAAQAFALAKTVGLDTAQIVDLIQASSGQSWMLGDRVPRALQGDLEPRAQLRVLTKDLGLAVALAREHSADLSLGEKSLAYYQQACSDGWASLDDAGLVLWAMGTDVSATPEPSLSQRKPE